MGEKKKGGGEPERTTLQTTLTKKKETPFASLPPPLMRPYSPPKGLSKLTEHKEWDPARAQGDADGSTDSSPTKGEHSCHW